MQPRFRGAVLLIVAALPGCASLSEAECHTVDWHARGLRDGHNGVVASRIHDYRTDCAEHGVVANVQAWSAGHQIGLLSYCTADRGYEEGISGRRYAEVCPLDREAQFLPAYRLGAARYQADSEIERINADQDRLHSRLREKQLSDDERQTIREQLRAQDRYLRELRQYRDYVYALAPGVPITPAPSRY
jgi:hypothetical protein